MALALACAKRAKTYSTTAPAARIRGGGEAFLIGTTKLCHIPRRCPPDFRLRFIRERERLILENKTACERCQRHLERLTDLAERTEPAGRPIPAETIGREADRALEDLEEAERHLQRRRLHSLHRQRLRAARWRSGLHRRDAHGG